MAWYDSSGWDYYPPYLSVGEKKARGVLALAQLLRKSKRTAEPVVIAHRKRQLTSTFWGEAWAHNLERYADLANRLPRGRAYLRSEEHTSSHHDLVCRLLLEKKKKKTTDR